MKKSAFLIFAFMLNAVSLYAAWDTNTKTAVMDFTISSNITELDPKGVSEILQSELVKQKAFLVLERSQIQKIMDEKRLELTGLTESEKASKLGSLLGADKIITGSISMIGKNYYIIIKAINTRDGVIEYSEEGTAVTQESIPDILHGLADNLIYDAEGRGKTELKTSRQPAGQDNFDKLRLMVLNSEFLNTNKIPVMQGYSEQILVAARDDLYNKYCMGWGWAFAGNFFVPSLGSYLQGDYTGGTITLIGLYGSIVGVSIVRGDAVIIFALAIPVFGVYNLLEPIFFAGDWNRKLKTSLILSMDDCPAPAYAYTKNPEGIRLDLTLFQEKF